MNRSGEILNYLAQRDGPCEIVIAPNAPPVTRGTSGRLEVALKMVLDQDDVADTLMTLRARASQGDAGGLPPTASFSFGVKDVGRFRIAYITQRGSKAFRIVRVPFQVPDIDAVSDDTKTVRRLANALVSAHRGVIAVTGPDAIANSKLVYSILHAANEKLRAVICVVERALTFLLAHDNSIVVQSELGNDVASFEDGIRSMFLLDPDIIFVGDLWPRDNPPILTRAVDAGMLTILSSAALNAEDLLQTFAPGSNETVKRDHSAVRALVEVIPAPDGKVMVKAGGQIPP